MRKFERTYNIAVNPGKLVKIVNVMPKQIRTKINQIRKELAAKGSYSDQVKFLFFKLNINLVDTERTPLFGSNENPSNKVTYKGNRTGKKQPASERGQKLSRRNTRRILKNDYYIDRRKKA